MPELPEVETVARDLRRHLLPDGAGSGPGIAGARVAWARTLRDEDPAGFVAGVTGRRIEGVGRRGKNVLIDLDGGAFLTVHLKMTGQLFVVPAGAAGGPVRARRPGARRRPRDPLPGRAQVRPDRAVRGGRRSLRRPRPRAARPALHAARLARAAAGPAGPAQAAARGPVVRRGHRQHLRRRGAVALAAPPAPVRRLAAPEGRARALPQRAGDPGRGGRAARQLHRRLHGARRRRRDAGAARRLPAHGAAVPALRPADPADRDRHPGDALLLVLPAAPRRGAPGGREAARDDDPAARAGRVRPAGPPLGGAGRRGVAREDGRRGRHGPRADVAHEGGGRRRRAAARAGGGRWRAGARARWPGATA